MRHLPTLRQVWFLLIAIMLSACGSSPRATVPDPVRAAEAQPTLIPIPTTAPSSTPLPTSPPTATAQPSATAAPSTTPLPPTATPPPPGLRVGLQVGHWQLENLPEELSRLIKFTGSYYGGYDEWEVNIVVAELVRDLLEAEGVIVDLLPTALPIGYQADALISIHANGATGAEAATRRGWMVGTPWRASPATNALAAAIQQYYGAATGIPDDPHGPSYNMRTYYAFAHYRFWHTIDPRTPSVIVEMGYMTHPEDRVLIFKQPERIAKGIAQGILAYLDELEQPDPPSREPVELPMLRPLRDDLPLYERASTNAVVEVTLPRTQNLVALAEIDGWYLIISHGVWDMGWVQKSDVEAVDVPQLPPRPRPD